MTSQRRIQVPTFLGVGLALVTTLLVLAGHLWDLHEKRDRFRIQVSAD